MTRDARSEAQIKRRTVLATIAAATTAATGGCATVTEMARGKGDACDPVLDGDISPPLESLAPRHAGYGYYILAVETTPDAGRTKIEISDPGLSSETVEDTIPGDESRIELEVNRDGPYEVTATSDGAGSTTVGVEFDCPDNGFLGLGSGGDDGE